MHCRALTCSLIVRESEACVEGNAVVAPLHIERVDLHIAVSFKGGFAVLKLTALLLVGSSRFCVHSTSKTMPFPYDRREWSSALEM